MRIRNAAPIEKHVQMLRPTRARRFEFLQGFDLASIAAVAALTSMLVLPRSFLEVKLALLFAFVTLQVPRLLQNAERPLSGRVAAFYLLVGVGGVIWSTIGLINGGMIDGIMDHLRLYVLWSGAYVVILQCLRLHDPISILHKTITLAGILVPIVNFMGLYGSYMSIDVFSQEAIKEMDMMIGYHDGYIQIMSQNIGSLCFIVPYQLAIVFGNQKSLAGKPIFYLSFVLSLALALASGRRALWLVIIMTPLISILCAMYLGKIGRLLNLKYLFICSSCLFLAVSYYLASEYGFSAFDFLGRAFAESDARSIQAVYLIEGFLETPFLGSGFGVPVSYIRSIESPWLYELTYHQLLFNVGIAGILYFGSILLSYLQMVRSGFRNSIAGISRAFPLLVGFMGFLIAAYSNPYLGSFDFLLVVSVLPLLASLAQDGKFA